MLSLATVCAHEIYILRIWICHQWGAHINQNPLEVICRFNNNVILIAVHTSVILYQGDPSIAIISTNYCMSFMVLNFYVIMSEEVGGEQRAHSHFWTSHHSPLWLCISLCACARFLLLTAYTWVWELALVFWSVFALSEQGFNLTDKRLHTSHAKKNILTSQFNHLTVSDFLLWPMNCCFCHHLSYCRNKRTLNKQYIPQVCRPPSIQPQC